jgi:hypothetical protein
VDRALESLRRHSAQSAVLRTLWLFTVAGVLIGAVVKGDSHAHDHGDTHHSHAPSLLVPPSDPGDDQHDALMHFHFTAATELATSQCSFCAVVATATSRLPGVDDDAVPPDRDTVPLNRPPIV